MRLIRGISELHQDYDNSSLIYSTGKGAVYTVSEGSVNLVEYGFERLLGTVSYQGEELKAYKKIDAIESLGKLIRKGSCWLEYSDGQRYESDLVKKASLIFCAHNKIKLLEKAVVYTVQNHFRDNEELTLIRYDLNENTYLESELKHGWPQVIDKDCYSVKSSIKGRTVVKIDENLDIIWQFLAEGRAAQSVVSQNLLDIGDALVINLCLKRKRSKVFGATIYCLSKENGTEIWSRYFPMQIYDSQLLDEKRIVVYSENKLFILDNKNGELIKTIETEFDVVPRAVVSLFVYNDYLFVFNNEMSCINIYETDEFACIRQINAAEHKWLFMHRPEVIEGKIYVEVSHHRMYTSLLIIDPNNINAPLIIEEEPSFSITEPSKEQGHILIEVEDISVDDLIRFGETVVLENMRDHGKSFYNETPNKSFNGQVILTCRNIVDPHGKVKDLLETMVERVKYFSQKDGFRCGKGTNPVSLAYKLN